MLDLLDDGGGHLAHTVSHRHPAGGADLQQCQFASVTRQSHLTHLITHLTSQRNIYNPALQKSEIDILYPGKNLNIADSKVFAIKTRLKHHQKVQRKV